MIATRNRGISKPSCRGGRGQRPGAVAVKLALVWIVSMVWMTGGGAKAMEGGDEARLRYPIDLTVDPDGRTLWALNERSGTLSRIDAESGDLLAEITIGQSPADFLWLDEHRTMLVVDRATHQLSRWRVSADGVETVESIAVNRYPVSIVVTADRLAVIASLWSRRLTFVQVPRDEDSPMRVQGHIDLPFAPGQMLLVHQDRRLIVGDAFAGRLGVVDMSARELTGIREIPGHNIRGLATSLGEEMLVVSHQMLNELAHTVRNDVHWGLLMSNDLRWLRTDAVVQGESDLYVGAHMHPLGQAGSATADPEGVCVTVDGTVLVALGGVGEIAIGREEDFSLQRVPVGGRPTAIAASSDGSFAYVANTFDDSISVVDVRERLVVHTWSLGEQPELAPAEHGERLFFDARLSHDRWMSCNSCHPGGHTNGMLNDNFSDGSFGAPKRVLSLLGNADTLPLAWNGEIPDLDQQVRGSIEVTMQSDRAPRDEEVAALVAFLQTLPPPPPLDVARDVVNQEVVAAGRTLFESLGCADCHQPPAYTSPGRYDVGIRDEMGTEVFNPPSLRGVSQRGPYFHDNRAATLESVFLEFGHQLGRPLSDDELHQLLAFLRSI